MTARVISRRCRNKHLVAGDNRLLDGRCRRCKRLSDNRAEAARRGLPMCPEGHGLVPSATTASGDCAECDTTPPPPPDDWLDWVAVAQVLSGQAPGRPLTKYETLCAIATVIRRNSWTRASAAAWLRKNTGLDVPADDGAYLETDWAPRQGLKPVTMNEALSLELRPDLAVADACGEIGLDGEPLDDDIIIRGA